MFVVGVLAGMIGFGENIVSLFLIGGLLVLGALLMA